MDEKPTRRGPGRPVTTGTKAVRSTRQGGEWDEADAIARTLGQTVHDVIGDALRAYVRRHRPQAPAASDAG